jgi:hypothetical protein
MTSSIPSQNLNTMIFGIALKIQDIIVALNCHLDYERSCGNNEAVCALTTAIANYTLLLSSTKIVESLSVGVTSID